MGEPARREQDDAVVWWQDLTRPLPLWAHAVNGKLVAVNLSLRENSQMGIADDVCYCSVLLVDSTLRCQKFPCFPLAYVSYLPLVTLRLGVALWHSLVDKFLAHITKHDVIGLSCKLILFG